MFFLFIIFIFIVILFLLKNTKIKWKSFFRRGFHVPNDNNYGVYIYVGKQGTFKTYQCVSFLLNNHNNRPIISNVSTLRNLNYKYIPSLHSIIKYVIDNNVTNCIIFYDEIFTNLTKSGKIDLELLAFLSQLRKRKIILLTTAQEWLEINITFRRYCRFMVQTKAITPPLLSTFLVKHVYDATQMTWSNDENDYICPLISRIIEKTNLNTAKSYDTLEVINTDITKTRKK